MAVGVWTLVAISLERYFAICRPLKSRIWQTRSHAYKMIIAVWILSLSFCLPVAVLSRLKPIRDGKLLMLHAPPLNCFTFFNPRARLITNAIPPLSQASTSRRNQTGCIMYTEWNGRNDFPGV